jgi:hypothetical protein
MMELESAVRKGDVQLVQALLASGTDPNGIGRRTPLMRAAASGHSEIARLLLEAGADPNVEDDRFGSALRNASTPEIVDLLLAHGARWQAEIPIEWLTEQADPSHLPQWNDPLSKERWERFMSRIAPGDEVWHFHSPPGTWEVKMGLSGFAIVRDAIPIWTFVAIRN